jgi:hypothetical protein
LRYFGKFPLIYYNLSEDNFSNPILVRNVFFRFKILESIKNNLLIYYPYNIKDGETPEIIAYKYYNDSEKHWLVLMANEIINPFYEWSLTNDAFLKYIESKYKYDMVAEGDEPIYYHLGETLILGSSELGITYNTEMINMSGIDRSKILVHHYEKKISKTDSGTGNISDTIIQLDYNTYANTSAYTFQTENFDNGTSVDVTTTTNIVYCYDYEYNLNESKKEIKLISKDYLSQIDKEFDALVSNF